MYTTSFYHHSHQYSCQQCCHIYNWIGGVTQLKRSRIWQMERNKIFTTHALKTRFHLPFFHFLVGGNNIGTKRSIDNQFLRIFVS